MHLLLFLTLASTNRLRGYTIRVSNDSNVPPSKICYKDPNNATLPNIIENACVAKSQYVWFYQTHTAYGDYSPMLEICEVKIYGKHNLFYQQIFRI